MSAIIHAIKIRRYAWPCLQITLPFHICNRHERCDLYSLKFMEIHLIHKSTFLYTLTIVYSASNIDFK